MAAPATIPTAPTVAKTPKTVGVNVKPTKAATTGLRSAQAKIPAINKIDPVAYMPTIKLGGKLD